MGWVMEGPRFKTKLWHFFKKNKKKKQERKEK